VPDNVCPECGAPIAQADINMAEGVALCRACGRLSRLGDVAMADSPPAPAFPGTPPSGCRFIDGGPGGETELHATIRSGSAVFFLIFATFWNSIVSIFVVIAIAGLYSRLIGPLPSWYPNPPMSSGKHGTPHPASSMSTSELTFMCLFLIPFVLVGIGTALVALIGLLGSLRIRIDPTAVRVRTGLGPLAWTRTIDPTRITRVSIGQTSWQQNNRTLPLIVIAAADREVKFGSQLSPERRNWMAAVLRQRLLRTGRPALIPSRPIGV